MSSESETSRVVVGLMAYLEDGRWAERTADAGGAQGKGGQEQQGSEGPLLASSAAWSGDEPTGDAGAVCAAGVDAEERGVDCRRDQVGRVCCEDGLVRMQPLHQHQQGSR